MTIATTAPTPTDHADARWRVVSGEHGIASLRHTHWLDDVARSYDGAPGLWQATEGRVIGEDVGGDVVAAPEGRVTLNPGEHVDVGRLRLRAIERDGALALRVFDPDNPRRIELRGILSFPRNDDWVLPGLFRPAAEGETRVVRSVDGWEREEAAVGVVAVEVDGKHVELTVSGGANGLSAVIADETSGVDAYRFRFLPIDAPDAENAVTVDFNRAYLPPCAFSDQYVCPLPPPGNRLPVRIEAGERLPDRG